MFAAGVEERVTVAGVDAGAAVAVAGVALFWFCIICKARCSSSLVYSESACFVVERGGGVFSSLFISSRRRWSSGEGFRSSCRGAGCAAALGVALR